MAEIGCKPDRFIFAVNRPDGSDKSEEAAEKVVQKLERAGAVIVKAQDTQRVLELAAD